MVIDAQRAADRASEPQASITQNKRIGAWHSTIHSITIPMLFRDALLCRFLLS
jgi:hypothetical protein